MGLVYLGEVAFAEQVREFENVVLYLLAGGFDVHLSSGVTYCDYCYRFYYC